MGEPELIFHITTAASWESQHKDGSYRHRSLEEEGFIHCSTRRQVNATWSRVFGGRSGLLVLAIDPGRLDAPVRTEEGEPGEGFPHVYGPIAIDAVVDVAPIERFGPEDPE